MLNAIFRPLEKWPGTATAQYLRMRGPFQADYNSTLDLLEFELEKIGAKHVTVQAQFERHQIRNDGWPISGAAPKGPAVIVSFTGSDGHAYTYPCDTFTSWQANLRAIALALEALRKVDRYGVTKRGEQYQGFRALPPAAEQRPKMLPEQAASFIASKMDGVEARAIASNQRLFEAIFKLAQQQLHPDAGGSHEDFVTLQEAGAVLTEHFKAMTKGAQS